MFHDNPETGWTFECPTDSSGEPPEGGLVVQKVRHHGYNFAKDVRVTGLWLSYDTVKESGQVSNSYKKFRLLGSKWGFTVSKVVALEPKPILNHPTWKEKFEWLKELDALNFSDYFQDPSGTYSAYGVMAKYEAPNLFTDLLGLENCEYAGLSIQQRFLFSRYSDEPPHEPSGALAAARFHPLVDYEFKSNSAFDQKRAHTRITSIRFDFRVHLFIDTDREYTGWELSGLKAGEKVQGNQAGLFADRESLPSIKSLALRMGQGRKASIAAFEAVEKPLVLEVTAPGLLKGVADGRQLSDQDRGPDDRVLCWDNVHWWGSRPPAFYVSSPGAFHAAHVHWRWGASLNKIAALAGPFVDVGEHFMPGQPLMDPRIFMQTIRVAVTKNRAELDPAQTKTFLSESRWEDLFTHGRQPEEILKGNDIVLWYSSEVHSQVTIPSRDSKPLVAAPSGTIFLHGIFFGHNAEQTGLTVGSRSADYRPISESSIMREQKWFRPAREFPVFKKRPPS